MTSLHEIPQPRRVTRGNPPRKELHMKLTVLAFLLSATAAFAGSTEAVTGCATVAVQGANYTTFSDPTCYAAKESSGNDALIVAVVNAMPIFNPEE